MLLFIPVDSLGNIGAAIPPSDAVAVPVANRTFTGGWDASPTPKIACPTRLKGIGSTISPIVSGWGRSGFIRFPKGISVKRMQTVSARV